MDYHLKKIAGIALTVGFTVLTAGSLSAHHAFSSVFDANKAVSMKGVIVSFDLVNPHSFMYVNVKGPKGEVEHWVLEGSGINPLANRGVNKQSFKAGETIEICGYQTKDGSPQVLASNALATLSGRLMSAELLTRANGEKVIWASYGPKKCLNPQ
jgi:hypothetical protein